MLMKSKIKILRNSLLIAITLKYVAFTPTEKGMYIEFSDTYKRKKGAYTMYAADTGKIKIPHILLNIYGLNYNESYVFSCLMANKDSMFVEVEAKHEIPEPPDFAALFENAAPISRDDVLGEFFCGLDDTVLTLSASTSTRYAVTLHMGETKWIDLRPYEHNEKLVSISYLRDVYGIFLQRLPEDQVSYRFIGEVFSIPIGWLENAEVDRNAKVRVILCKNGRILIAPPDVRCDFNGESIDRVFEPVYREYLCGDCKKDVSFA